MTAEGIFREALMMTVTVGGPLMGILLIVGLMVGVLQSATQIQEPAVGAVPRLATLLGAIALFGPMMMERFAQFTRQVLEHLAMGVGS